MKPADLNIDVETLAYVNELLPTATPVGAYAMGMATMALHRAGLPPSRIVYEAMCGQQTLSDAADWLEAYIKHAKRPPLKEPAL